MRSTLEANDRIKEAYIATGRLKHHEQVPEAPKGRPQKNLTAKEKMARKLRTKMALQKNQRVNPWPIAVSLEMSPSGI